jgi:hypothetical protein
LREGQAGMPDLLGRALLMESFNSQGVRRKGLLAERSPPQEALL